MTKSIFASYIDKFFKGFIGKFTELFNGKKEEQGYLYTSMLTEEYTPDLTWNATSLNNSIVAADVVSMDSSLPLKKRDTLSKASGDIAKLGIKKQLREKQITDIMVMQAKGQQEADIARRLLNNVPKVISGIHTRVEIMFEQALSTGYVLIESDNEGTGIRADFGYLDSNKKQVSVPWTVSTSTPITDLREKMFDVASANGDTITDVYLSEAFFNNARKTTAMKEFVAVANQQVVVPGASLSQPNRQKTLDALRDEFNAEFHIVNNSYRVEDEAGNQTTVKPWEQGNVIGVTSPNVGRLVYGTLAEEMRPVAGVTYQKSGFILVSEYSVNEPSLAEVTAAQALALPVIDDGGHVYLLDANNSTDVEVTPDNVAFSKRGGSKTVKVDSEDTITASASDNWITATPGTGKVVVAAAANTGEARKGSVTITVNSKTAVVVVSQDAGIE